MYKSGPKMKRIMSNYLRRMANVFPTKTLHKPMIIVLIRTKVVVHDLCGNVRVNILYAFPCFLKL